MEWFCGVATTAIRYLVKNVNEMSKLQFVALNMNMLRQILLAILQIFITHKELPNHGNFLYQNATRIAKNSI